MRNCFLRLARISRAAREPLRSAPSSVPQARRPCARPRGAPGRSPRPPPRRLSATTRGVAGVGACAVRLVAPARQDRLAAPTPSSGPQTPAARRASDPARERSRARHERRAPPAKADTTVAGVLFRAGARSTSRMPPRGSAPLRPRPGSASGACSLLAHAEHEARVARAPANLPPQCERQRQRHGQHARVVALCAVTRADGDARRCRRAARARVCSAARARRAPRPMPGRVRRCLRPGARIPRSSSSSPARSSAADESQAAETRWSSTV